MARPIKSQSPSRAGRRMNVLSPLQTFSPLSNDMDLPKVSSPTTLTGITPSSKSPAHFYSQGTPLAGASERPSVPRSGSMGKLHRSLSQHERVFSSSRSGRINSQTSDRGGGGITTRLLLVKAPPAQAGDPPLRQRSKSSSSLDSFASAPPAPGSASYSPPKPIRKRSFAAASFSSFGPATPPQRESSRTDLPSSAQGSTTPRGTATRHQSVPSLTPDEVWDLARGLMSPVAAPFTPEEANRARLARRKSARALKTMSVGSGLEHAQPSTPPPEPIALEPVEYVEMDAEDLLPFSHRPSEVLALLTSSRNAPLLSSLEKIFPKPTAPGVTRDNWKDIDVWHWTWPEFYTHLTVIDRPECPDYEWVLLAREAVRHHSVSLWEKLGACLGCDTELMMAGEEDEAPASWGGLGLGDEGEYDGAASRVVIEGLEPRDPEEAARAERELTAAFDDDIAGMDTIAETPSLSGPTTAQRAGAGYRPDTFPSPGTASQPLGASPNAQVFGSSASSTSSVGSLESLSSPLSPRTSSIPRSSSHGGGRKSSFVGLQIVTSPQTPQTPLSPGFHEGDRHERTPGNPLFVSSFNTLSLGPTLGRKQSTGYGPGTGGVPVAHADSFRGFQGSGRGLTRQVSGTGFSESAITFVSDSSVDAPLR